MGEVVRDDSRRLISCHCSLQLWVHSMIQQTFFKSCLINILIDLIACNRYKILGFHLSFVLLLLDEDDDEDCRRKHDKYDVDDLVMF